MQKYCILGTGAVGGYYGALLHRAGQDIYFLVRSDYEYVKKHGLRIDSINGDFTMQSVQAYYDPKQIPKCDVVLVAWKTTENKQLADVLSHVLKPNGIVVVLQNGLDPEKDVADCFPGALIMGGLCFLGSRKQGPGWIVHQAYGAITFAAYPQRERNCNLIEPLVHDEKKYLAEFNKEEHAQINVTDRLRQVQLDFSNAGVETHWHEDWRVARWSKLVWNVPFNGLCSLLQTDTFQLLQHESMRRLIKDLMLEVVNGAKSCGVSLAEDIIDRMMISSDEMLPYEPSMKLDFDLGRPLELHAIYGRPIEEINKAGGSALRMEMLLRQLQFLTVGHD